MKAAAWLEEGWRQKSGRAHCGKVRAKTRLGISGRSKAWVEEMLQRKITRFGD